MRTLILLSSLVIWALPDIGAVVCADTIVIENGGRFEFGFSFRRRPGEAWSKTFELEPGQRRVLQASQPVVVSYWTDQARFATLQPGDWYRIDDPRKGVLRPVSGAMRPPPNEQVPPPKAATDADSVPSPDDATVRVLRLSAIADSTYRQVVDNWRERIRQTIAGASKYYETNFQIRLELDEMRAWEYRGLVDDVQGRIGQVLQQSPEPSEMLVAFVGFGEYYKTEEQVFLTGHLGLGLPFGQHLMVTGNDDYHVNREIVVLIHELAHAFGAFHVADRRSLMQPVYDDAPIREIIHDQLALDAVSMGIIRLSRAVDFRRGVTSLDAATQRQLKALARRHRHPTEGYEMSPVGTSHRYRQLLRLARAEPDPDRPGGQAPIKVEWKAGDRVVVDVESAPVHREGMLLAEVPRNTTLTVLHALDDRLFVAWESAALKGWLRADQLASRSPRVPLVQGQAFWTIEEAELFEGSHLLSSLPPGVRVTVQRVAEEAVRVSVERQVLGQYQGGKLIFEPALEGWIDRAHVRPKPSP